MSEKKVYVNVNLQDNEIVKLKADTVIALPAAAGNDKRIVYYNGDYYYSDGTGWTLMANVVPTGGTTGQVLTKTTGSDYDTQWTTPSTGGGILSGTASGTDTYTASITGVTSYTDGDAYLIRFTNGNTVAAPTLNINGLGAVTLYRNNDGQLIGGDIVDGGEMLCVYNSTLSGFQTIGTAPNTLLSYVTNADSVTLTKGMPVYAFGGTGDRMTVKRAYNTLDATSAQTVGLVLSTSIGVNQKGLIMMQGLLDNLSILPTSTFADGDPIYLGATPGSITNIKPYAPNHLVYLGVVTTASNGNAGRMYVRVQNGYELDELHNVQAQNPNNNDTIYYDSSVSQWKTASLATILGYTPENVANKENTTLDTSTTKYPTNNLVKTNIDAKVTANVAITGATKTKITYDSKGLVTSGADATTADIADSLNKRYVTDAQLTVISNTSGTNTGNETVNTLGATINAAAAATPNDADLVTTVDTSVVKKITWTNVKAFLKTYFDTLYAALSSPAFTGVPTAPTAAAGTNTTQLATTAFVTNAVSKQPEAIQAACSDEITALSVGTGRLTFRAPFAITLTSVRISCTTAPTGAAIIVNVRKNGTTIFSTKPQIAAGATTSVGGAVPGVLSTTAIADDDILAVDIDQIGSTVAGTGLKITFLGTRT